MKFPLASFAVVCSSWLKVLCTLLEVWYPTESLSMQLTSMYVCMTLYVLLETHVAHTEVVRAK